MKTPESSPSIFVSLHIWSVASRMRAFLKNLHPSRVTVYWTSTTFICWPGKLNAPACLQQLQKMKTTTDK